MASSLLYSGRLTGRHTAVVAEDHEVPVAVVVDQGHEGHKRCRPSALIAARDRAVEVLAVAEHKVCGPVNRPRGEQLLLGEGAITFFFYSPLFIIRKGVVGYWTF